MLLLNSAVNEKKKVITILFQGLAGELVNVLREAGQVVPSALLKFGTHVKKKVLIFLSDIFTPFF